MNTEIEQNGILETEIEAVETIGTKDYNELDNKPYINGVELNGEKSLEDLGIDQDFVKDDNYVHTDNNYTTTEKTKLANLENYDDTEVKSSIRSLDTITTNQTEAIANIEDDIVDIKEKDLEQDDEIASKQDELVSGTNIKTINNTSILGSGNIEIQGGGATYTAGENIQISSENVISATDTVYDDTEIKGDIADLETNKADVSDIPDVSDFITNAVDDLINYYLKSETYTKAEVNQLISAITTIRFEVVSELPVTGESNIIYLVPSSNPETQNVKDEYIWVNSNWEKIGSTDIDLSNYVTTTQLNTALANYTTTTDLTTLLNGKQNVINSSNKLNSDLVDDSLSTNKFMTGAEKTKLASLENYDDTDIRQDITDLEESIPTKTSDLTNDSGFIDTETDPVFSNSPASGITSNDISNWNNKSDFSGDYDDLTNKPTIPTVPTNVSAFTNDAGYLTSHQDISGKEDKSNKVTSMSSSSTDAQYPSAKAVFDALQNAGGETGITYLKGETKANAINLDNLTTPGIYVVTGYITSNNSDFKNNIINSPDFQNATTISNLHLIFVYVNRYSTKYQTGIINGGSITPENTVMFTRQAGAYSPKSIKIEFLDNLSYNPNATRYYATSNYGLASQKSLIAMITDLITPISSNVGQYKLSNLQTTNKTSLVSAINELNTKISNIAPTYSNAETYSVGDIVFNSNILYKCTTAVDTAEDFDSSKWTQTTVAEMLNS